MIQFFFDRKVNSKLVFFPADFISLVAGADSLIMESSRRVTGAGKRKGLNPVKQVLLQPSHEVNSTIQPSAETSRLTASPDQGEKVTVSLKRSREAVSSAPLDLSVSKAEVGGRCRKQVWNI